LNYISEEVAVRWKKKNISPNFSYALQIIVGKKKKFKKPINKNI